MYHSRVYVISKKRPSKTTQRKNGAKHDSHRNKISLHAVKKLCGQPTNAETIKSMCTALRTKVKSNDEKEVISLLGKEWKEWNKQKHLH